MMRLIHLHYMNSLTIAVSKNDKKMDAGKVKFILLKSVGDAYIDRDITDDQMRRALEGVIR